MAANRSRGFDCRTKHVREVLFMRVIRNSAAIILLASMLGCAGMSSTQQKTLSGGAIGAAGGAALGAITGGSPAVGAAVGGAAGALGGFILGESEKNRR